MLYFCIMKRYIVLILLAALAYPNIWANKPETDTLAYVVEETLLDSRLIEIDSLSPQTFTPTDYTEPECRFRPVQLIAPAVLLTAGAIGVKNPWCNKIKTKVFNQMGRWRNGNYMHFDDYVQYLPIAAYLSMGAMGVKSKHNFRDRVIAGATAYVCMVAISQGVKYTVREKRPDSNARNSFPSGHTSEVFTGAELVRSEYPLGVGIGAYTVATGIAFMRLYNNRHWLNDVIAGAGVGILSGRVGYWMLPVWRRWLKLTPGITAVAMPSYNPETRTVGLAAAITF